MRVIDSSSHTELDALVHIWVALMLASPAAIAILLAVA
jgi:hypothetical protein